MRVASLFKSHDVDKHNHVAGPSCTHVHDMAKSRVMILTPSYVLHMNLGISVLIARSLSQGVKAVSQILSLSLQALESNSLLGHIGTGRCDLRLALCLFPLHSHSPNTINFNHVSIQPKKLSHERSQVLRFHLASELRRLLRSRPISSHLIHTTATQSASTTYDLGNSTPNGNGLSAFTQHVRSS
jgi:hypothetical protein